MRRVSLVFATIGVCAVFSFTAPAVASGADGSPSDEDEGASNSVPWDEAPHIDESTVPEPDGAYGDWQADVNVLVEELAYEYPDAFGYGVITMPGAAEIHFAHEIPRGLPEMAGVQYFDNLGYTQREAHEFALAAFELASASVSSNTNVAMQYLVVEELVSILVSDEGAAASVATAATTVTSSSLPLMIDVEYAPDLSDDQGEALGAGAVLRFPSSGNPACSSAFPVTASQGRQGILSAGHCPASVHYWKPGWDILAVTTSASYVWVSNGQGESGGYGGDARWYWSSGAFSGETYVGANHRRFTAAGNAVTGSQVCRYGITTGYACGTVRTTLATIHIENNAGVVVNIHPVTCITVHNTNNGDSGGPWFFNYTAYGVHSGGSAALGSCFTPMPRILGHFQLALLH